MGGDEGALGELPRVTYDGGVGGPEEHAMIARAELIHDGGGVDHGGAAQSHQGRGRGAVRRTV